MSESMCDGQRRATVGKVAGRSEESCGMSYGGGELHSGNVSAMREWESVMASEDGGDGEGDAEDCGEGESDGGGEVEGDGEGEG